MALSAKTMRVQMARIKPLLESRSLEVIRRGQNLAGELMGVSEQGRYVSRDHIFENFTGIWVIPKDQRRQGVMLYIHGGGFTCGNAEYAKGVGITMAVRFGTNVFCPAYRLAPEAPFPAGLEDCLQAYLYLMEKGYDKITLCGESAGGGLCYSLCQLLLQKGLPMPCGIVAISPWVDLSMSGDSYRDNLKDDPTMSAKYLQFCAEAYCDDPAQPLVSPLQADLSGMPPSLIFAAKEELLLSDARRLHSELLRQGAVSALYEKAERWHAYIVYNMKEDADDFDKINRFLNRYMSKEKKLQWMRLDNAAKIYPAARTQHWSNVFRLSATLKEEIDVEIMQSALDVTVRRFPMIAVRLRRGTFWYYLQQLEQAPEIRAENSFPLAKMSKAEARRCALRVIVYKNRVAVEYFHSLTDGTGGLVFLKTLVAEYLQQKYDMPIPSGDGILPRLEMPRQEELEDSFLKYAGPVTLSRKEDDAWHITGTPEQDNFLHLTCFTLSAQQVLEAAHKHNITVTAFLAAVMTDAIQQLQKEQVPNIRRRKAIKVQIPINLRKIFPSESMRNFAFYTTPQINTCLGEYSFEEICKIVHHWMGYDITPQRMSMKIAANVNAERNIFVKLMPLFVKNIVMKAVFNAIGECKSCLSLSNLGMVKLPREMEQHLQRLDFVLGVQAAAPYNCGVIGFQDKIYVNFIRNTREPSLEMAFFKALQRQGLSAEVCSNQDRGGK